jgi:hypothetical protein
MVGRDRSVGIATGYGLDGQGIESRLGRGVEVKECVQLYLYSSLGFRGLFAG